MGERARDLEGAIEPIEEHRTSDIEFRKPWQVGPNILTLVRRDSGARQAGAEQKLEPTNELNRFSLKRLHRYIGSDSILQRFNSFSFVPQEPVA